MNVNEREMQREREMREGGREGWCERVGRCRERERDRERHSGRGRERESERR